MTNEQGQVNILRALSFLLIAGFAVILFFKIGSHPIVDWDEGIYAQIARQAIDQHSFIDLHWFGSASAQNPSGLWFEKPPLMFWLTEMSFSVFGVTEFAARFWSTLFALGVVVLSYFFAKQQFKSETAGLFTVLVYYLGHFFISQAWFLKFDIPVTFFILASLLAFHKAKENAKYYWLFWTFVGLGVLTKSVIGLMPLPIIFIYLLAVKDFSCLKNKTFYYGSILFLALILPWHIVESLRYGKAFWATYLGFQVLTRYATPIEGHNEPLLYYFNILKDNLFLFWPSVLAFLYFVYKAAAKTQEKKPYIFLLAAFLFPFLLFSFSSTKLASYILPAYPFYIIITAKFLADLLELVKNSYFKFALLVVFTAYCVVPAIIYNQSKINDSGYFAHYYQDDQQLSKYVQKNYPNLPVLLDGRDQPALMFYLNKRVYSLGPNTKITSGSFIFFSASGAKYPNSKLLAQGYTTNLYLVTIK
jgi:4-amino-4-deoxy-L-arabinose transferase-like glycosyltransferase